jgi:hypothetical protein
MIIVTAFSQGRDWYVFSSESYLMTKTFVAINDPVHNLLRNVTRRTPLSPRLAADGIATFVYHVRPEDVPAEFYTLATLHTLQGWSVPAMKPAEGGVTTLDRLTILKRVNYFDAVRIDRRCTRDLRRKVRKFGPGMLGTDLLSFGIGMLRARNDDPEERIHDYLWSQYGRLYTRHEVAYARIRALHRNALIGAGPVGKESFDSTNVIYGDAFGELQQLWDRRADTAFLDQVARSLQAMREHSEVAAYLNPPLNLDGVMHLHRRAQSRWKTPPASGRALLRRLEFILDHTTVDLEPQTVCRPRTPQPEARPPRSGRPGQPSATDVSGYDGWLPSPET